MALYINLDTLEIFFPLTAATVASSYVLQEDGASYILQEDGTSKIVQE